MVVVVVVLINIKPTILTLFTTNPYNIFFAVLVLYFFRLGRGTPLLSNLCKRYPKGLN